MRLKIELNGVTRKQTHCFKNFYKSFTKNLLQNIFVLEKGEKHEKVEKHINR